VSQQSLSNTDIACHMASQEYRANFVAVDEMRRLVREFDREDLLSLRSMRSAIEGMAFGIEEGTLAGVISNFRTDLSSQSLSLIDRFVHIANSAYEDQTSYIGAVVLSSNRAGGAIQTVYPKIPIQESDLVAGKPIRDWVGGLVGSKFARCADEIRLALSRGEKVGAPIARIIGTREAYGRDGLLNVSRNHIFSLGLTICAYARNRATLDFVKRNEPIIKAVQLVSIFEKGRSEFCKTQNGRVIYQDRLRTSPPFHIRCRLFLTPLVGEPETIQANVLQSFAAGLQREGN